MQFKTLKCPKIKALRDFSKIDPDVRLPSSPLENPVKSRVCGLACCLGNKQVTTFTKGEHLNGVSLVKILEIS